MKGVAGITARWPPTDRMPPLTSAAPDTRPCPRSPTRAANLTCPSWPGIDGLQLMRRVAHMGILTLLRNAFGRSRRASTAEAEGATPVAGTDGAEQSARADEATAATPTPT